MDFDEWKQWHKEYKAKGVVVGATLLPRYKDLCKDMWLERKFLGMRTGWHNTHDTAEVPKAAEGVIVEIKYIFTGCDSPLVIARFGDYFHRFYGHQIYQSCFIISEGETKRLAHWKDRWEELMGGPVEVPVGGDSTPECSAEQDTMESTSGFCFICGQTHLSGTPHPMMPRDRVSMGMWTSHTRMGR